MSGQATPVQHPAPQNHSVHTPQPNQPPAAPLAEKPKTFQLVTANEFELNQVCLYLKDAIQFKLTRFDDDSFPTIAIETTKIKMSHGRKTGDWKNSQAHIFFKCTLETEVVALTSMLLNKRNTQTKLDFAFHGAEKDKVFKASWNEDGSLFIQISKGKQVTYNHVLKATDQFNVCMLLLRCLAIRHSTDANTVANMLRAIPI